MKNKSPNTQLSMTLKDGRQLGFAEYGSPDGKPIFFFHGLPGCRLDASHFHKVALSNHYRLIGIDRPGMGLSTINENRSILSWADDVEEFANHLALQKFAIMGHSGGAPFVAACAYRIPERLDGVAIVAGMGPFEIPEATACLNRGQRFINHAIRMLPWMATACMKLTVLMFKHPKILHAAMKQLPEIDRLSFHSLGSHEEITAILMEPFKGGVSGPAKDMQLTVNPWGFSLANIKLNCPVTIWQGGLDRQAPAIHAELYASLIPNAKLTFFKQEGHISLLVNKIEEILQSITV